jgi:hypothetical protein
MKMLRSKGSRLDQYAIANELERTGRLTYEEVAAITGESRARPPGDDRAGTRQDP